MKDLLLENAAHSVFGYRLTHYQSHCKDAAIAFPGSEFADKEMRGSSDLASLERNDAFSANGPEGRSQ